MVRYIYLGDKLTRPELVGMECDPVRDICGVCIVGRMGSAMVKDKEGNRYIVLRRRLRLKEKYERG